MQTQKRLRDGRRLAQVGLDQTTVREDPREKLKALRAEFAKKAADAALVRSV
jgi:ATP-dependent DNA helicase Rep